MNKFSIGIWLKGNNSKIKIKKVKGVIFLYMTRLLNLTTSLPGIIKTSQRALKLWSAQDLKNKF